MTTPNDQQQQPARPADQPSTTATITTDADATRERDQKIRDVVAPAPSGVQNMIRRDDTMASAFQGLLPASLGEAVQLSERLARSQAIPSGLRGQPETVLTIIMAGVEIGLTPIRALQSITNIKGNLAMRADLQLALVRRSGTMEYFNEGFELANKTDGEGSLQRRLVAAKCPDASDVADLIMELTDDVPDGKPYGWACLKRRGDDQLHVRVFSWNDAERFIYNARDDEGDGDQQQRGGPRVQKKLSEKSNYVNTPQDMYPKRARVRVMQVTHSDVLAGMPAIEAMDTYIDAEVVHRDPVPTSSEDTIAELIGAIAATDANLAMTIQNGFEQLQMGIAKRLQKLREYQANPPGLVEWLKTEWANRHSKGGRATKDVLGSEPGQGNTPAPASADTNRGRGGTNGPKADTKPTTQDTKPPAAETTAATPAAPTNAPEALKSIAARFTKNLTF